MGMFSNYLQNKIIDFLYRGQAFVPPATLYVALLICTHGIRQNSTAYGMGDTVAVQIGGRWVLYACSAAGSSAGGLPAEYLGVPGEVVVDGTASFTEQTAALDAGAIEVEPFGGDYARVPITSTLAAWAGTQGAGTVTASDGTSGLTSNNGVIQFPTATADWAAGLEMAWGAAIYDDPLAGNLLTWEPFVTTPSNVVTGATVSIAAGQFLQQFGTNP
jgi:hypothetical protein